MSVQTAHEHSTGAQWDNADEIDLGRYLAAVGKRWPEILIVTLAVMLLTAAGVWAWRTWTPPVYESTATVAIVRTLTDVQFDERFTTISEQETLDTNSRRMALIALANSGAIAEQVIAELGEALPAKLRDPAQLLDAVKGEMATVNGGGQSDLINISVRTEAPETAALIANTWARAYVLQVNSVYGQAPDDMLSSVAAQLAAAQATYAEAQARLEDHLGTSPLDALMRQSAAISDTLNLVQGSQLRLYHDQWLRTSSLLAAARGLAAQLAGDGAVDTAGTALALQVLKVQAVNAATATAPQPPIRGGEEQWAEQQQLQQQPPTTLQLQLAPAPALIADDLREQVAATVAGLEAQLALLEANIAQAAQGLGAGESLPAAAATGVTSPTVAATWNQLEEQARTLAAQVEVEKARTLAYTEQRDLAWESVDAVANKQAELLLARAGANSEVRLSSAAVPLNRPADQISLAVALVLALLAGLLLGIVAALVLEAMNVRPLRSPRAA